MEELKGLLLGDEQQTIQELQERIEDRGIRARDVAQVLPSALALARDQGEALERSLEPIVARSLKGAIHRDMGSFADALFPVMGPAIRRAIVESLRGFLQSFNHAVEESLSIQGLKWRWEAWRSGSSYASVVLRHRLLYRVEEAYLIHRETGLLIEQASIPELPERDSDAVAGMLVAIQQFARDSFSSAPGDDLDAVELGDRLLWVVQGPYAMIACVIRNEPPAELRSALEQVLETMHERYGEALQAFSGDPIPAPGLHDLLNDCLRSETNAGDEDQSKGIGWISWSVLLLVLAGIAYGAWSGYQRSSRLSAVRDALERMPGLVLLGARWQGDTVQARGLLDPGAIDPAQWLRQQGQSVQKLDFHWQPYLSLDHALILQRLREAWLVPETVKLQWQGDALTARGVAPLQWLRRASQARPAPIGVGRLDWSGVRPDPVTVLDYLKQRWQPPESVQLSFDQGQVRVVGEAPLEWIRGLRLQRESLPGVTGYDLSGLTSRESRELRALVQSLDGTHFGFIEGTVLTPDAYRQLDQMVVRLRDLLNRARALGMGLSVQVTGYSDGLGSAERKRLVRAQRAEFIRRVLQQRVGEELTVTTREGPPAKGRVKDPRQRRVDLQVQLRAAPVSGPQGSAQ